MEKLDKVIEVTNETRASFSRVTKEGKKVTYKLQVIQQPKRARACGSGAKSSADRRPIDPPPIVELRIFEGENAENDITFQMNASYFLFATLEQARLMAHGRVQQDSNRLTVLTGTPVAGLVYLDRPVAAGYFLFPDLSVRHEGKYRLSFNLYEELREEKDQDKSHDEDDKSLGQGGHVTHRLEVKSQPFVVYSAKKFPGLKTSTDLSRMVAEQGCRVRIRKDVRMARKDKNGKVIDDDDQPTGTYGSPHGDYMHRLRSDSVSSQRSLAPSVDRRQSDDMSNPYHQQAPLSSVASGYSHAHYAAPPQYPYPYQQQPPSYPQQSMLHAQRRPSIYTPQPGQAVQPPSISYYTHAAHGPPPVQPPQQPSYEPQYHARASDPEPNAQSPVDCKDAVSAAPGYTYQAPTASRQIEPPVAPSYVASQQQPRHLASYQPDPTIYPTRPHESSSRPPVSSHKHLPALDTSVHQVPSHLLEPSSPNSTSQSSSAYSDAPQSSRPFGRQQEPKGAAGKRSYGEVFDTHHINGPMRSGARPSVGQVGHIAVDPDEATEEKQRRVRLSYKRADGRQIVKALGRRNI